MQTKIEAIQEKFAYLYEIMDRGTELQLEKKKGMQMAFSMILDILLDDVHYPKLKKDKEEAVDE